MCLAFGTLLTKQWAHFAGSDNLGDCMGLSDLGTTPVEPKLFQEDDEPTAV